MLKKTIALLLFVCYVSAASNFIGNAKKRAKLFELTDNEVAVFHITLPPEEFEQLKEDANSHGFPGGPPGGKGGKGGFPPPPGGFNATEGGFPGFPPPGGFNATEGGFPGFPPPGGFNDTEGGFPGFPPPGDFNFTEGGFPPPPPGGKGNPFDEESFKTKNATMTVKLNGDEKSFDKVTVSLGGSSSRTFGKQGFNLKVRGKDDLYGRTQFRLRPDAREATFLRSKLVCDMHNRLGLPSISANYAQLYINDEYMGFYILLDSIKLSWVEFEYGDKNSTTLYQCKNMNNNLTVKTSATGCVNENEEVTDNTEWVELLTALDDAKSAEDIEDIFDVDQFLTEIAYEYLAGSWDHYLNFGHNFYMYKPKDDKWKFLLYDFDGEIGQDVAMGAGGFGFGFGQQKQNTKKNTDYPTYSFEEWAKSRHLIDILILNNSTRFDNIVKKFVTDVFNPATLFPHIDELKEFIKPYVKLDKTPDENGKYPGKLNESAGDYSLAQWDANCEFTMVRSAQNSKAYGLKHWILSKYRYICKNYDMECDEKYLDENYEYPIDEEVDVSGEEDTFGPPGPPGGPGGFPGGPGAPPQEGDQKPEDNSKPKDEDEDEDEGTSKKYKCWVEQYGYPCCTGKSSELVLDSDEEGDWGYDFENGEWCGITPYKEHKDDKTCWSEIFGYKCCKNCYVYETDNDGKWGYDFDKEEWCGIQSYCEFK